MRGGKFVGFKRVGALGYVGAALLAIPGVCVSGTPVLGAEEMSEKSIVISTKRAESGEESPSDTSVTQVTEGTLQPIARITDQVPDLADPPTAFPVLVAVVEANKSTPAITASAESVVEANLATDIQVSDVRVSKDGISKDSAASESSTAAAKSKTVSQLTAKVETEVINFNGITPGISRRIEVLREWGDPRTDDTQAKELNYRFDGLKTVNVRFEGDLVDSIFVELAKPMTIAKLTQKLNLEAVRPATLKNNEGVAVAQVYPERGVMLSFVTPEKESAKEIVADGVAIASDEESPADQEPRIDSIVIQPLEAEPFLLRAGLSTQQGNYTNTIADLEAALQMDSSLSEVLVQLSEIHLKNGKAITAERYAAEAVELHPQSVAFRLQWAKCLRQLARYDLAVKEVRVVLETSGVAPLVRAQALNEMGLLASLGSQKVMQRAMALHAKAIEIADGLAVHENPEVSRPAKELLVEAHLAIAVEISLGTWQQKDESVPQWIERASALSEALIEEDPSYLPLRLQVVVSSLAAVANLEQPIDPLLWVEEAEETVAEIKTQVTDPLAASQYDWQLGLVYFHGSQIQHRRSEPDSAIKLGELADVQLSVLAKQRDEMPDTAYLLGRLYFQIGAVHAVHFDDHVSACEWYDEAVDRLLTPVPVTTIAAPQQHGDALVSMGVSYWNQDNHRQAIKVTESGVELIEEAVVSGLLEPETLKVSYGNLSAMYTAEGEQESAARYQELAREITSKKKRK